MKKPICLAFIVLCITLSAQPNTDVYLFDYDKDNRMVKMANLKNISNNEGYDNQPSFYDENTILYAATRNNQTDIAIYNIKDGTKTWLTNTGFGSEYSPLKIPNQEASKAVSAIRLDTTGLQRLYKIDMETGEATELIKDLVVGYHVWYDENTVVSSVLVDNRMDLVVSNLKDKTNNTLAKNVGRSLHKIPNSDLIGFISKEDESWTIKSINPITAVVEENISIFMSKNVEDICWLNDGTVLFPDGNSIMKFSPMTGSGVGLVHRFEEAEINKVSRMAVSPDGKHFAIVSEVSPTFIVKKQVETFNNADLDNFAACFSDDVVVRNFPNDTMYVGNANLKSSYEKFYARSPNTKVQVLKRIVLGNNVIDEERVTVNGKTHNQVAVYEIANNKIKSMTFIHANHAKTDSEGVEKIVQRQLDAYNERNLDDFAYTFLDNVKAYNFPNKLLFEGKERLRTNFEGFFERTPNLNCEIKNRIVIGNIVIDEEYITANENNFSAVAIYEVQDGKIATMTFVR